MKGSKILACSLCIAAVALSGCAGGNSTAESSAAAQSSSSTSVSEASSSSSAESTSESSSSSAESTSESSASSTESSSQESIDYSNEENWAYFAQGDDKEADLFLVCPTVDMNDEYNMSMEDESTKSSFLGALNMEKGIYEDSTRMYAPYYRQAAMKVYELDAEERESYLETAYEDVSEAFSYYLENENQDRPIILAGFSQGADMCYRLLEEYFGDEELSDRLVAVYAIGWPLTEEMTEKYPQLKAAESESDTGVIVSFECESEDVNESFIVPADTKMLSINPLNWKTDSTVASKDENKGACFTNYKGEIKSEQAALCGAYIDSQRGTLKVTDVSAQDYPPVVSGLPEGEYHVYDYQFFYRNLQENVAVRLQSYLGK